MPPAPKATSMAGDAKRRRCSSGSIVAVPLYNYLDAGEQVVGVGVGGVGAAVAEELVLHAVQSDEDVITRSTGQRIGGAVVAVQAVVAAFAEDLVTAGAAVNAV